MNESDATDLVAALFDRWYMALVRYPLRTTGNYELAEDLAQETFMLSAGKSLEHPKAWTVCVMRRAMNRQMKDRSLHEPLDELEIAGNSENEQPGMVDTSAVFFRCSHLGKRRCSCSDSKH